MPNISRSALVMHSVEEMFLLINDVENYPHFLPDCGGSKIISQSDTSMTASILVAKGGIKKWFTTENTLITNHKVTLSLVDGPFKYLTGEWVLTPLSDEACKIHFELDYEFSNKVLALAFGRVFTHLINNIVQAFTMRAKEVYAADV
ncbi:type II toxin-antitoxin system RatA family toxin [Thalassotalea agariperforans]